MAGERSKVAEGSGDEGEVEGAAVSDIADGRGQPGMALKLALVVVWLAFLQECGNELTDDLR